MDSNKDKTDHEKVSIIFQGEPDMEFLINELYALMKEQANEHHTPTTD